MTYNPIFVKDDDTKHSIEQLSIPEHYRKYLKNIMISNGLIKDRIEKLAQDLHEDYQGKNLHLVCVLKGGEKVFSELSNDLDRLNSTHYSKGVPISLDFIKVSSYNNTTTTGDVNVSVDTKQLESFREKNIVLIEDIIDTGITMIALKKLISNYNPESLKVLSLLTKRTDKNNGFIPDYCGFSIPDEFVVGYCLDYNQHFRDLQHICSINSKGIEYFKE